MSLIQTKKYLATLIAAGRDEKYEDDLNIVQAIQTYPNDLRAQDPKAFDSIKNLKENSKLVIYRGINGKDPSTSIKYGDWVSPFKSYALSHGGQNNKLLSMKVKAKDVIWAGDTIHEFFYLPN